MQLKESKSSWHFVISLFKSSIRIWAGVALVYTNQQWLYVAGLLLILAEILGIIEEL